MKTKTSTELNKELRSVQAKIRALSAEQEAMKRRQAETVFGGLEYLDLEEAARALAAQLPALIEERRALSKELARALAVEGEKEYKAAQAWRESLMPKVEQVLETLQAAADKASAELVALAKTGYPAEKRLPDISISLQVANAPYQYHINDNALHLITFPLLVDADSKRSESRQLMENLAREMGGR